MKHHKILIWSLISIILILISVIGLYSFNIYTNVVYTEGIQEGQNMIHESLINSIINNQTITINIPINETYYIPVKLGVVN